MPPLHLYKTQVDAIRQELLEKQGRKVKKVVLMSGGYPSRCLLSDLFLWARATDETDPLFWNTVKANDWTRLDHIVEERWRRHGEWYPSIIDQRVVHSMAAGFVGTHGSTFSLVGARRVEDWNNGYTTMIDRLTKYWQLDLMRQDIEPAHSAYYLDESQNLSSERYNVWWKLWDSRKYGRWEVEVQSIIGCERLSY